MGLDRYRVKKNLSSAGGVETYLAADADGREVELWMLDRLFADPLAADRIRRRVRLAALLEHPGALPILESSLDEPPLFLVRPSRPASALECHRPATVADAARVARQLIDALAVAHRLGLAHGALTRANIGWEDEGIRLDFVRFDPADALPEDDLRAAGEIIDQSTSGIDGGEALRQLATDLRSPEPPSAAEALRRLDEALPPPAAVPDLQATRLNLERPAVVVRQEMPARLGRFRLVGKLGQGGMGTVYRAIDTADDAAVAIKVLNPDLARNPKALRRFEKEARMLASVRSTYVANLLDINEDNGVHFLALEFVQGQSLRALLDERKRLDEALALNLTADVCRALSEAHARGVVHRDIKPENVLLADDGQSGQLRVKLTDFGLARQMQQSESLDMTRENVVGTPLYMAPEQGRGGTVDARTDIYSLGATLFHLLAGEPPFTGDSPMEVLHKHANEPPPRLQSLNTSVSDGACRLIERAMAKSPAERFADAATMLAEIERLLRGEPSSLAIHPLLPPTDPQSIKTYEFRWELRSSPEQLWPYVSNTERLNRAIGLPAVNFTLERDGGRVRRFGAFRKAGMNTKWEEHPFEWIEGRRFGVLRVLERGPFEWLSSVVELAAKPGGGTLLTHRLQLVPRGVIGRLIAKVEIGVKSKRNLERVYRESDEVIQRRKPGVVDDPFDPSRGLSGRRHVLLRQGVAKLIERGIAPVVAERLEEYLTAAPEQSVTRIRPLAVAEQLALDPNQFVNACLHGVREGLLVMLWDILCPTCRIPSQVQDSLRAIREHGRCEACNLDFELDFANSVEMIFRAHPDIRPGELGTYCIGGPAHSPHVAAQVRVAAGERMDLNLDLGEGAYKLRGPQLDYAVDFQVKPGANRNRWELLLSRRPGPEVPRQFALDGQSFALVNDTAQELLVRVERTAPRTDALTAARAASLPLFRELFPAETLAPGQLVSIAQLTLLVTELDAVDELYRNLGDAEAFTQVHEHFRLMDEVVRGEGGAVVKTVHNGLIASFAEPLFAVRAALRMPRALAEGEKTRTLRLRCGVHRGAAYTATINDRLDYFGMTVTAALQLPRFARPGGVVISRAIETNENVNEFLRTNKIDPELINTDSAVSGERFAYWLHGR